MGLDKRTFALVASTLISGALGWLLPHLHFYATLYLIPFNPLPHLLYSAGVPKSALSWALFPFEFALCVLVSAPVAYFVTKLKPAALPWYTTVAVLPSFVYLNIILYSRGLLDLNSSVLRQTIQFLLVLPCSLLLVHWLSRIGMPNNSFKPKPLRRSA